MQELRFSVSPDSKVKTITYGTIGFILGVSIIVPYVTFTGCGLSSEFYTLTAILFLTLVIIPLSWAYSPKEYILTDDAVVIKRPAKDIVIPYSSIKSVNKRDSLGNRMIRQMGNGGLFSFSGTFRSREEGKMKMYVKNTNYVVIEAGEKYVISPDERDEFLMMLKARLR